MAALIAAEYPIYGRFGFGPATETARWLVDARDLRFRRELPGRIELIDPEVARFEAAALYDRVRENGVGMVSREGWRWDVETGQFLREGDAPPKSVLHAVCRDATGQVVGYTAYRFTEKWTNQRPDNTLHADAVIATDPIYEARLWKHLADHDWVTQIIGPEFDRLDALWRDLLVDRRLAVATNAWDFVWLRCSTRPRRSPRARMRRLIDRAARRGRGRLRGGQLRAAGRGGRDRRVLADRWSPRTSPSRWIGSARSTWADTPPPGSARSAWSRSTRAGAVERLSALFGVGSPRTTR